MRKEPAQDLLLELEVAPTVLLRVIGGGALVLAWTAIVPGMSTLNRRAFGSSVLTLGLIVSAKLFLLVAAGASLVVALRMSPGWIGAEVWRLCSFSLSRPFGLELLLAAVLS